MGWDVQKFDFMQDLDKKAPPTVNPSLWRQMLLNYMAVRLNPEKAAGKKLKITKLYRATQKTGNYSQGMRFKYAHFNNCNYS